MGNKSYFGEGTHASSERQISYGPGRSLCDTCEVTDEAAKLGTLRVPESKTTGKDKHTSALYDILNLTFKLSTFYQINYETYLQ